LMFKCSMLSVMQTEGVCWGEFSFAVQNNHELLSDAWRSSHKVLSTCSKLFLCLQPKPLSISCVWNFILMRVEWERNSGSHFHVVQRVWKYIGGSNSLEKKKLQYI
jgi:hypothetical protein